MKKERTIYLLQNIILNYFRYELQHEFEIDKSFNIHVNTFTQSIINKLAEIKLNELKKKVDLSDMGYVDIYIEETDEILEIDLKKLSNFEKNERIKHEIITELESTYYYENAYKLLESNEQLFEWFVSKLINFLEIEVFKLKRYEYAYEEMNALLNIVRLLSKS